jgi:hypothetical protein
MKAITMTAKKTASTRSYDLSLIVLTIVLLCTNAWFLPHILTHMG